VLIAVFGALGGCATDRYHLMATPLIYRDERLDLVSQIPEKLRSTRATVFYATRRAPVAAGEPGHYGSEVNEDGMRLGVAQVELGEPGWTFDQLAASDRTSSVEEPRPGRVERIEEIGTVLTGEARSDAEREFIARINAHLAMIRNPEVVVYVHGYRVAFDEVAVMMGSLSSYLGYGATVPFVWPTGLHWWNYTDCARAEKYIPDIEGLIELLGRTKAEFINVFAYSCGSPLLAAALSRLRTRYPDEGRAELAKRYRIGNVVFAASDVDLKRFARDYVPPIMDIARQAIVYMSRRDAALGFSSLVAGASRIGRPDIADLTTRDIERLAADLRLEGVDVTDVRGAHETRGIRGHGYWYSNEWIANDVLLSLRYPIPPDGRCLVPIAPGKHIWRMPDDYPDCIVREVLKVYPRLQRKPK
jgi:esterase/lipase superfamily enzyme